MTPIVSIVVPSHNRASHLAPAIDSVRSQTIGDWEVVIVDDGSTDATRSLVAELAASDPRIVAEAHPVRRGAQAARNTGIARATGDWIGFLDSDDTYLPDSLERRLRCAERTGSRVVHSECLTTAGDGTPVPFGVPPMTGRVYRDLLQRPGPMFQGLLVHRETLANIERLDESIVAYQEWDTSIRLARNEAFAFVPEPTFLYNVHTPDAISRDARRSADGYEQVVRKHRSEIVRQCGRQVLSRHYRFLVEERMRAGDRRAALRCATIATWSWPFSLRGNARSIRALLKDLPLRGTTGG